jgi:hypothetical protein
VKKYLAVFAVDKNLEMRLIIAKMAADFVEQNKK